MDGFFSGRGTSPKNLAAHPHLCIASFLDLTHFLEMAIISLACQAFWMARDGRQKCIAMTQIQEIYGFSVVKVCKLFFSIRMVRVCLRIFFLDSCQFMSFLVCAHSCWWWFQKSCTTHSLSIEPYEKWDSLHINWCRIVSINSTKQLAT